MVLCMQAVLCMHTYLNGIHIERHLRASCIFSWRSSVCVQQCSTGCTCCAWRCVRVSFVHAPVPPLRRCCPALPAICDCALPCLCRRNLSLPVVRTRAPARSSSTTRNEPSHPPTSISVDANILGRHGCVSASCLDVCYFVSLLLSFMTK